jgi:hypothetical protein
MATKEALKKSRASFVWVVLLLDSVHDVTEDLSDCRAEEG